MTQSLYYFILKVYKGLFIKKHRGNVHTLLLPTGDNYTYFVIIGELQYQPGTYIAQSSIRISPEQVRAFRRNKMRI